MGSRFNFSKAPTVRERGRSCHSKP